MYYLYYRKYKYTTIYLATLLLIAFGSFLVKVDMSKIAVNILVSVFWTICMCISLGYISRNAIVGHKMCKRLTLVHNPKSFPKWLYQFTLPPIIYESSLTLKMYQSINQISNILRLKSNEVKQEFREMHRVLSI
jgi:hypothetical protein